LYFTCAALLGKVSCIDIDTLHCVITPSYEVALSFLRSIKALVLLQVDRAERRSSAALKAAVKNARSTALCNFKLLRGKIYTAPGQGISAKEQGSDDETTTERLYGILMSSH